MSAGTTVDSRTSELAKYLGTYVYCVGTQIDTSLPTSCLVVTGSQACTYAGASLTDTGKYIGLESKSTLPHSRRIQQWKEGQGEIQGACLVGKEERLRSRSRQTLESGETNA